jgi:hypothetical protein
MGIKATPYNHFMKKLLTFRQDATGSAMPERLTGG